MSILRNFLIAVVLALVAVTVYADPVDINTASAQEIASALTGVGASKAAAIVDYRTENGPFQTVEELTKVSGIGAKTLEANRANVMLGEADTAEQ